MYIFRNFRFRITLRSSVSFFGTSKIGLTSWSGSGQITKIADLSCKVDTSEEIEIAREGEGGEEERTMKGGGEMKCNFNPNLTI